jgi:hypothetical protein
LDRYRERISEFCIEVTGCVFCGLVAKCDGLGRKLLAFGKAGKEQDECLSKYCCSLTCRIISRISIGAGNFRSSLNCPHGGSRDTNKHLSSSTSVSSIFSAVKSAVVIPRRKFRFASFSEYFEAFPLSSYCELFNSSSSFRVFKLICVSQRDVKGITVGRNRDIYVLCCPRRMSHCSVNLTAS